MFRKIISKSNAYLHDFVFADQQMNRKNVIYSGGMLRSGSTLLYNIIRLILEDAYSGKITSGWVDDIKDFSDSDAILIKSHSLSRKEFNQSRLVFFSYRDIRACLMSYSLKFNTKPDLDFCRKQIKQYEFARKKGAVMLSYEMLTLKTREQIALISEKLNVSADTERILKRIPLPVFSASDTFGYDPLTLLHNNHSSAMKADAWKEELDKKLLDTIQTEFKWWFEETGYEL